MTSPSQSAPTPPWAAPYLPEFEEILRVVELAGGFVLQPLEIPGPDLARALGDWLAARGHPAVVREPQDDAEWKDITGWLLDEGKPPPEGIVMVLGSRDPPEGVYLAMRLLNERRDAIAKRLGCPLFWCGPASFLELTAVRAPDFWSVRAVERRLRVKAETADATPAKDDLLEEARKQGDVRSVGMLTLQRAREALAEGRLDDVEALIDGVPGELERVDSALYVNSLLMKVEVARRRGKLDAAHALLGRLRDVASAPEVESRIDLMRGRVYETAGKAAQATHSYSSAQDRARRAGDGALYALACARHSALYSQVGGSPDKLVLELEQTRTTAKQQGDVMLAALVSALLAGAEARLHARQRAQRLLAEARDLANRAKGNPTVLMGGEVEEAVAEAERALGTDERAAALAIVKHPLARELRGPAVGVAVGVALCFASMALVYYLRPPEHWCFDAVFRDPSRPDGLRREFVCAGTQDACVARLNAWLTGKDPPGDARGRSVTQECRKSR